MDDKIIWSIGFVLVVMILCYVKPNIGRIFLGIFYLIMAVAINIVNAITNPETTVQMGEESLLAFYRTIFTDIVSRAPSLFILAIAAFQIIMGLLILNKHDKVKIGLIGTIVFLVMITPFGYIQLPWLGIALIQIYLLRKDFDKTLLEILRSSFHKVKKDYSI
jgi:hypothetical protein